MSWRGDKLGGMSPQEIDDLVAYLFSLYPEDRETDDWDDWDEE